MKKLTAGIFTALLGLVTVNAANAAIPSTTYVDTKITTAQEAAQDYADTKDAALKTAIETDYEAADTALDGKITDNANAISAMDTAYKAADTALDGRVDTLETTVGSGAMTVNGAAQADVIAAINALDTKTNGIATNENLDKLQQTVTTHTNSLNVLNGTGEGSVAKAEADANDYTDSEIAKLSTVYDAAGSATTAESNANDYTDSEIAKLSTVYDAAGLAAAAESSAKAYAESKADAAQSAAETYAKNYADGLATNYDAAGAAATAQANAETYTDGKIDALAATYETKTNVSTAVQEAKDFASNAATQAGTDAKSYADSLATNYDAAGSAADALADAKAYANTELAKKVDKTGHAASQVVITDSTGAIATAAQIPNTQVSGLGDLATKSTIADADVAADAAIAQSKIAGLEDALANTTPKVTARGEAGTYVLTAIVSDSGATSYQWEQIERPTTGGEG